MQKCVGRTTWSCTSVLVALLAALVWIGGLGRSEPTLDTPNRRDERNHQSRINEAYGRVPLHFEANHGQTDDRVKFLTRGRGYTMFLTQTEAVLTLSHEESPEAKDPRSIGRHPEPLRSESRSVLRMTFAGGNPIPRVVGQEKLPGKANYFIGKDPAAWRVNVPTYARVRYDNLFPGIDLVYYGNQRALEYDFVVQPGADPTHIGLRFEGADKIEVDAQGDLVLHAAAGAIRQRKPLIYQEVDGVRREISGGYVLAAKDTVGFEVAAYDATRPLVIDPVLFYSTFLGGSTDETGNAIAVDSSGSAYVTGNTNSIDFPTTGGLQPVFGGSSDAYVTKLNPTGSTLVYSTYLGGTGGDVGLGIVVDAAGSVYLTGNTSSSNFPATASAFDTTPNGSNDAFVAQLNSGGSALVYATYLGGTDFEGAIGIAVDLTGNAYVTGATQSLDFPTTLGAFDQIHAGEQDAFVTKVSVSGSALVYSTYLAGNGLFDNDAGISIAVDGTGFAYVAGVTTAADFPTTPLAFQTAYGGNDDVFVTKLNLAGSALVYSTYLGGTDFEGGGRMIIDVAGNAYVTGITASADFPTMNPFQAALNGDFDAFVTRLNGNGSALVYSTYLGGTGDEEGLDIAVDTMGSTHIIGRTTSTTDFPIVPGAFQGAFGGGADDAFVTKLNPMGSGLVYSSYLGGSDEDANNGAVTVDDDLVDPIAYVAGSTRSADFPTTLGAFQETAPDQGNAYVAQIIDTVLPPGPTTGRVKGQGTISVPGGVGKFHLIVQRQTDGTLSGKVQYTNKVSGAKMKSETITSMTITGNSATINGTCGTSCTFTVDVTDNSPDGSTDTFTISVNGAPAEGGTLQKGDIQIQQ